MMDRLLLAVACSLVAGTQAGLVGFPIRSKNGVMMQGDTELLQSGRSPMQLLVKNPPEKMSCDNVPCFEATSDKAIKWKGKDKCIEAIGHKNGDAVRLNDCTGAKTQKWNWIPDGDGGNLIQIQDTNLCLETNSEASFNGFSVQLHECHQTAGETWKFEVLGKFEVRAFSSKYFFSFDLRHLAMTLLALAGLGAVSVSTVLARQTAKAREFAQHRGDACIDEGAVSLSAHFAATEIAASTSGESFHAPTKPRASDISMYGHGTRDLSMYVGDLTRPQYGYLRHGGVLGGERFDTLAACSAAMEEYAGVAITKATERGYDEWAGLVKGSRPSSATVITYFGTWSAACSAVGIAPGCNTRRLWDTEACLAAVGEYLRVTGEANTKATVLGYRKWARQRKGSRPSSPTVIRHFGTWSAACTEAGISLAGKRLYVGDLTRTQSFSLRHEGVLGCERFDKEACLAAMEEYARVADEANTTATCQGYDEWAGQGEGSRPTSATVIRYFRTWSAACTAVGIAPGRKIRRHFDMETCAAAVGEYLRVTDEANTEATCQGYEKWAEQGVSSRPCDTTVLNCFGTWSAACTAAGISLARNTKRFDTEA